MKKKEEQRKTIVLSKQLSDTFSAQKIVKKKNINSTKHSYKVINVGWIMY